MKNITEKELRIEEKKWEKQKALIKRKKKIESEKRKIAMSFLPKIQTTKFLMFFLFINCLLVELFTGYITLKSFDIALIAGIEPDLAPLVSLVGTVVSEVIAFAIYSIKSTKENTRGGIVFESAMKAFNCKDSYQEQEQCCQQEYAKEQHCQYECIEKQDGGEIQG